jgi:hypothetical protein
VEEIKDRCISRKEYLKRDDSNVGYALHVQNNIKKDDYARFNTGEIVKVTGIRENQVNKKAIYFGAYDEDWCDSAAVENFSENIIDLIEVGDIVEYQVNSLSKLKIGRVKSYRDARSNKEYLGVEGFDITKIYIKSILTHEQYNANCYKIEQK